MVHALLESLTSQLCFGVALNDTQMKMCHTRALRVVESGSRLAQRVLGPRSTTRDNIYGGRVEALSRDIRLLIATSRTDDTFEEDFWLEDPQVRKRRIKLARL